MRNSILKLILFAGCMLFSATVLAQEKTVTGIVTDANGLPMPGVNIVIEGTTTGTQTDFDGEYNIEASPGNVLVFSFLGTQTVEQLVGEDDVYDIVLEESSAGLDEVVVVGYGSQRKADVTGAVSSANLEPFRESPNVNIAQSLQGTVPGLTIGQVNSAGETPDISIRGQTSLGGNSDVLIVVDGIMFTGSLSALDPDNIASIDVLKDASSTAVYGAQGANGVILITTKSGRKNQQPTITYTTSLTTQSPATDLRPLSREGYINKLRNLYYDQAFLAPDYEVPNPNFDPADVAYGSALDSEGNFLPNDFDWWDAATKTGFIQEHKVNINGGGENVTYLLSAGYTDQTGYIINDNFRRKNVRANIDVDLQDWWTIGTQSFATFNDYSGSEPSLSSIIRHAPVFTPFDEEGELIPNPTGTLMNNPFQTFYVDDYDKENYLFGNFYSDIDVPFIPGLNYRINFGNNYRWDRHYFASEYGAGLTGSAYKTNSYRYEYTLDNILTYRRTIADDHDFTVTLLYGATERNYEQTTASGQNYSSLTLGYNSLQQGSNLFANSGAWREALNYQMGRINYNFQDKYLVTATVRRDGFSGFAANEKWGIFPSVALGWAISEESFFNSEVIDYLKFRGGYGSIGNLTSRYFSLSTINRQAVYVFGDGGSPAFGQELSSLANPNLRWESTDGINLGIDFRLFNGRIDGNIEYYDTETKDQLFPRSVPSITGVTSVNVNLGNIRNRGMEFSLNSRNVQTEDFSWRSTLIFSRNVNEIVTLTGQDDDGDGVEDDIMADDLFIGESIGTIFGYERGEMYQIGDDIPEGYYPGTYRVIDQNGDGEITPDDRIILGRSEPAYRAGLLNTFSYKNLTLNVFLNTVQGGRDGYLQANTPNIGGVRNDNAILLNVLNEAEQNFWSPSNPGGLFRRSINNPQVNAGGYQERSFVRLQDISLSYNFSPDLLDRVGLQDFRLFASGKNLATWTDWIGWDPETGQGISDNGRPVLKGYSLGLSVTF